MNQETRTYYETLETLDTLGRGTPWERAVIENLLEDRPDWLNAMQKAIIDRMKEQYL